jgi:hypothetical protein
MEKKKRQVAIVHYNTPELVEAAILSDVQYTAQNRQRSTCQVTLTGKKNMLIDLRYIITADDHYIRTADNHIVMAAHQS